MKQKKAVSDIRDVMSVTEVIGPEYWQLYKNGELSAEGENWWGFLPVVHMQNIAQPYYYEGLSDVEPLVPLQDELNIRLSDRANRITFQSFICCASMGCLIRDHTTNCPSNNTFRGSMNEWSFSIGSKISLFLVILFYSLFLSGY